MQDKKVEIFHFLVDITFLPYTNGNYPLNAILHIYVKSIIIYTEHVDVI